MTTYPTVSPKSPYQMGARVQLHAYAGRPNRANFRGEVVGGFGTNALWVRTDTGIDAVEEWSHLTAEGEIEESAVRCTCCRAAKPAGQLDLFAA